MWTMARYATTFLLLVMPLVCSSCVVMTAPKSAKIEGASPSNDSNVTLTPQDKESHSLDKRIVATWELVSQEDDQGRQEEPRASTRTLIEFTDRGKVIFNRIDREDSRRVKSRTGQYVVKDSELRITDDVGNSVRWPYKVAGDMLVIVMPEEKRKFHWRKSR